MTPIWIDGPPPESQFGSIVLVLLKPELFNYKNSEPWKEYHDDPVAVRWWGHKGKTTFGVHRIDTTDIVKHCCIEETPR